MKEKGKHESLEENGLRKKIYSILKSKNDDLIFLTSFLIQNVINHSRLSPKIKASLGLLTRNQETEEMENYDKGKTLCELSENLLYLLGVDRNFRLGTFLVTSKLLFQTLNLNQPLIMPKNDPKISPTLSPEVPSQNQESTRHNSLQNESSLNESHPRRGSSSNGSGSGSTVQFGQIKPPSEENVDPELQRFIKSFNTVYSGSIKRLFALSNERKTSEFVVHHFENEVFNQSLDPKESKNIISPRLMHLYLMTNLDEIGPQIDINVRRPMDLSEKVLIETRIFVILNRLRYLMVAYSRYEQSKSNLKAAYAKFLKGTGFFIQKEEERLQFKEKGTIQLKESHSLVSCEIREEKPASETKENPPKPKKMGFLLEMPDYFCLLEPIQNEKNRAMIKTLVKLKNLQVYSYKKDAKSMVVSSKTKVSFILVFSHLYGFGKKTSCQKSFFLIKK